MKMEGQDQ